MWNGLLGRMTGGDPLTSLLSAVQSELGRRNEPVSQNGEGLVAQPANPAPYPDLCVTVVVCLPKPTSVTDNRVTSAKRTPPWQKVQRDHPGSALAFGSGSGTKRITAGVGGLPLNRPRASLHLSVKQCRMKKEYYIKAATILSTLQLALWPV